MAEFKPKEDYLEAAERHLHTCRYMIEHLDKITQFEIDNYKLENILLDIYYLAGYIIECSVSFGMLVINKENEMIIISNDHITIKHSYQSYIKTLGREKSNLKVLNLVSNSKVNDLYEDWKPDIRYSSKSIDKQAIIAFVGLAESIYTDIKNCFTKSSNKTSQSKRSS